MMKQLLHIYISMKKKAIASNICIKIKYKINQITSSGTMSKRLDLLFLLLIFDWRIKYF